LNSHFQVRTLTKNFENVRLNQANKSKTIVYLKRKVYHDYLLRHIPSSIFILSNYATYYATDFMSPWIKVTALIQSHIRTFKYVSLLHWNESVFIWMNSLLKILPQFDYRCFEQNVAIKITGVYIDFKQGYHTSTWLTD
jgi:hypothetical protein